MEKCDSENIRKEQPLKEESIIVVYDENRFKRKDLNINRTNSDDTFNTTCSFDITDKYSSKSTLATEHFKAKTMKKIFKYINKIKPDNNASLSPNILPIMKQYLNFDDDYKESFRTGIIKPQKTNNQLLVSQIEFYKKKLTKDYFIVSAKYDDICYKYNTISLTVMILSTILTFTEAFKLTLTEYMNQHTFIPVDKIEVFTLSINIFSLLIGTIITVLSGISRFKNYREIMEKMKNYQNMVVKYITLYNKQIDLIKCYDLKDLMDDETFNEFSAKIKEYNKEINENINILEDINNKDMIKLEKYQHKFDIRIEELKVERELEFIKLQNKKEIELSILKNSKDVELFKIYKSKNKKIHDLASLLCKESNSNNDDKIDANFNSNSYDNV